MHLIGRINFRTRNIVKNMNKAASVEIIDGNHIIVFNTEFFNKGTRSMEPSTITYKIKNDIVDEYLRK